MVKERGEILHFNGDMERATGKNGRNLKGTDAFYWFNDPARVRQLFEQAVETGDTVRGDNLEIQHRDGFEPPVSTTIVVQQASDDRILGGLLLRRAQKPGVRRRGWAGFPPSGPSCVSALRTARRAWTAPA